MYKPFVQKEDAIALTIIQFLTASFIGVLVVISQGEIPTSLEKEAIYSLVYLGFFYDNSLSFPECGQSIYNCHKGRDYTINGIFFGMVLSVIFLHEMLTSRMVVGAVLILLAILIAEVKPAHPKRS